MSEHDDKEMHRLAALGELGGSIAHEVGNALTAVLSLAQVGRRDPDGDGDRSPGVLFSTIEAEVMRAIGILERYVAALDGRRREVETTNVELATMVRSVAALVAPHLSLHRVRLDIDALAPGAVAGRDSELRQILLNLIVNARDAAGEGGRIRVGVARVGESLELRVVDTGPGVPAAMRDKIFEPYVTTKRSGSGTGRGLALSRQIARDHGGDLTVEDGPLGGAAFVVRLPSA
jgi:signal transduction histidine kinase